MRNNASKDSTPAHIYEMTRPFVDHQRRGKGTYIPENKFDILANGQLIETVDSSRRRMCQCPSKWVFWRRCEADEKRIEVEV
jgi:hypothetical protein